MTLKKVENDKAPYSPQNSPLHMGMANAGERLKVLGAQGVDWLHWLFGGPYRAKTRQGGKDVFMATGR